MKEKINNSLNRFIIWLEVNGNKSYDVYDFWSSSFGVLVKRLYNRKKILAFPFIGLIQFLDSFFPRTRYFFSQKKRFPMGDGQLASGFLNYYRFTKNEKYLQKASEILDHLLKEASKTAHGFGWGNPYYWVTVFFEYPPNQPLITVTPYCFDAFFTAFQITENIRYYEALKNISNFVAYDMKETEFADNTQGCSYGIDDNSLIYNAIAYRSLVLLKAGVLFKDENFVTKSKKNIDYVIMHQNDNGSWYYSADSQFIDNFHTCFVLKNIAQAYNYFKEEYMLLSLKKGYDFYKNNFVRTDGTLRHFYKRKYPKFRKIEFYDYAEAIKLGIFLKDIIPEAFSMAESLSVQLISSYQSNKGFFYTRINLLNIKNTIPYLRWPQAQLFNSLSFLLLNLHEVTDSN